MNDQTLAHLEPDAKAALDSLNFDGPDKVLTAHMVAHQALLDAPYDKSGALPQEVCDARHNATDRLIRTHQPSLSGIAYKLWEACHIEMRDGRPFDTLAAAEWIGDESREDHERLMASAFADLMELTRQDEERRKAFDDAKAAFEAASAAVQAIGDRVSAAFGAVDGEVPIPTDLKDRNGGVLTEHEIEARKDLPVQERLRLLALRDEWIAARRDAHERHETEALEAEQDTADEAWVEAVKAVWSTTPPDMEALAYQLRTYLEHAHDHADGGPDTVEYGEAVRANWRFDNGGAALAIYHSVLLHLGRHVPSMDAPQFEPKTWIEQFEELHGPHWEVTALGLCFHAPETGRPPNDDEATAPTEYNALPNWKRKLIREEAREREEAERVAKDTLAYYQSYFSTRDQLAECLCRRFSDITNVTVQRGIDLAEELGLQYAPADADVLAAQAKEPQL
jgi:hypothetical protein